MISLFRDRVVGMEFAGERLDWDGKTGIYIYMYVWQRLSREARRTCEEVAPNTAAR